MLQGIRASTLTMPPYGHDLSSGGVSKVGNYSDNWAWSQQPSPQPPYTSMFDPSVYANANFASHLQPASRVQPRHHSIATSHVISTGTATPPPPRHQVAGNMVKAQPAFKPTWTGFLDTTKDAMTIVEAALQGRLNHISRRPHDKERAEMLTSGTVLVYEENASGIKRWTDAVHWSPSRVMNNCLIYRQLMRALKPEEKKTALNPSCGTKRKRKESAGSSITKTGDHVNNSDDEYENPSFDGALLGEVDSAGKVYANFAQSLTPDQQRRFCGSLIDSYEFKEGGLMKKTISVKYQGTHHHVISYYSLEDVVSGKLKRPFQDPRLDNVQPRPELLTGWKVSLEDEESKDMPLIAGYSQHIQPSHVQHHAITAVTQTVGPHGMIQTHGPPHLQVPQIGEYWHGGHVQQHYASPQPTAPHNAPSHPYHYSTQQPPTQHYVQPPSPQPYPSPQPSNQTYPAPPNATSQYAPHQQAGRHYSIDQQQPPLGSHYPPQVAASHYAASHHSQPTPPPSVPQYSGPPAQNFDIQVPVPQSATSVQAPPQSSVPQHDPQRRASAPVAVQHYSQPQYHPAPPHPAAYYVEDAKYPPNTQGY
ncbi:Gti1/Pac2 family-domain-containing protein [Boeremia exigua]|uniref:Gti1/Pac2 family-domain-containing protein n=1 Tax=Boeremia exigua TaxID=749465 RepID=UPI001E8CB244|nr:Gti1/Pac2 family-domain-containing protein [Boeremia exigua]KAH6622214.1 Gti1/Pac2 family-domain-containing protein [Boeremia exigua]